jgi:hypothetical protein
MKPEDVDCLFWEVIARVPFPRLGSNLTEFHWDDNSITPNLIHVLKSCTSLRVLSIRCAIVTGEALVCSVIGILMRHPTLENLRIGVTQTCAMARSSLQPLCIAFSTTTAA